MSVLQLNFAESLKKLEEIVKSLETGALSLEESLEKFEEGVKLSRRLEAILNSAETKVQEVLSAESEMKSGRQEDGTEPDNR